MAARNRIRVIEKAEGPDNRQALPYFCATSGMGAMIIPAEIRTTEDLRNYLAKTMNDLRQGKITVAQAQAVNREAARMVKQLNKRLHEA